MTGSDESRRTRLDRLVERVRSELSGQRGQDVRRRVEQARDQAKNALNSEQAQRARGELDDLRSQARGAVDDALSSKAARDIAGRIDSVLINLEKRVRRVARGDQPESDKRGDSDPPA